MADALASWHEATFDTVARKIEVWIYLRSKLLASTTGGLQQGNNMSETHSRHVKTQNNSVSLNSWARKPSVWCLTVQKVQLLESYILQNHVCLMKCRPEDRLHGLWRSDFESESLAPRTHFSWIFSAYVQNQCISIPAKSRKLRAEILNSYHSYHSAKGNSQISLATVNVYCQSPGFHWFSLYDMHCCHKLNSCSIYNRSLFSSE